MSDQHKTTLTAAERAYVAKVRDTLTRLHGAEAAGSIIARALEKMRARPEPGAAAWADAARRETSNA